MQNRTFLNNYYNIVFIISLFLGFYKDKLAGEKLSCLEDEYRVGGEKIGPESGKRFGPQVADG